MTYTPIDIVTAAARAGACSGPTYFTCKADENGTPAERDSFQMLCETWVCSHAFNDSFISNVCSPEVNYVQSWVYR